jgi:cobaltochelatase CobS
MSIATLPAWKSYRVGSLVRVGDVDWTITNIEKKATDGGYTSRLFHLKSPDGVIVVKTSRGITYWQQGGDPVSATEADVRADAKADRSESSDTLLDLISAAVAARVESAGFDADSILSREAVAEIVEAELAKKSFPQRVEIVRADGVVTDVGVQHSSFPVLLRTLSARKTDGTGINVWLVGPAGSGKTSAAHACATALGLTFRAKSVGPQTSESSLLGYYDANGKYVRTQLRDAFEFGGVFLLDEVDAGNPAVLVVINAVLANGSAAFPDGVIPKHKDFILVAGANTIGQGADRQYVGRQQVDAATLDRFAFLQWDYDPSLISSICGVPSDWLDGLPSAASFDFVSIDDAEAVNRRVKTYCRKVVGIFKAVASLGKGVRVVLGTRGLEHGIALIRVGFRVEDALDACVWKGLDADTRKKIESNC